MHRVEVSRLLAHFQIGAEVEILSTDDEIWYPGKVVDLKLCEGLEELTVEYTTLFADQHRLQKLQDTITADKIRPATPTSDQKSFEMMDKVEVFYNNGWSSGQISMRMERWSPKMADKVKPDKKRKAAASSQNSGMDNVFLRRSERVPKRSRDTKLHSIDPFSTLRNISFQGFKIDDIKARMHETSLSINDNKIRKSFFQSMENAKKDLKKEHIDEAFAMLNCVRNENAAWFHNYKIPKCFLPMEFLHCLLSHDLAYKKEKVKVLISDLLVESSGDEVDKVKMIPFEVEQAQGLPKTKHPFNCGIFLVKILECQSLKIGDMTKINDDNALELRRTLSCEIFNQFVDESFGK
ncbi:hypothetical protein Bca52824_071631 [Brassica carinata]|uniref:Agenet domain-containing protein n=1 Tax=Brassica carinata TaxID=52824 RepID=A0A8X7Q806_BRACI|nr:hypothetical protein Bca52824_071631 [Brassica carinata]